MHAVTKFEVDILPVVELLHIFTVGMRPISANACSKMWHHMNRMIKIEILFEIVKLSC